VDAGRPDRGLRSGAASSGSVGHTSPKMYAQRGIDTHDNIGLRKATTARLWRGRVKPLKIPYSSSFNSLNSAVLGAMIKVLSKSPDMTSMLIGGTSMRKKESRKLVCIGMHDSFSLFPTRLPPRMEWSFKLDQEAILQALASDWQQVGRDLYIATKRIDSAAPRVTETEKAESASRNR